MQRVIERILNLLAFLLTVQRPVTADEIRNTVAGYDQDSDAAFRRTFERDKDLLRSLGVPLEMTSLDIWEVESGYVIPADDYAIADPGLTEEERSALLVAAQAVQFAGQTTGLSAIFKLGGASPVLNAPNVAADLGHGLDVLGLLFEGISLRRNARFTYSDKPRTVRPYALAHRFGHWYLAAPETADAKVVKAFRVDRMTDVHLDGESGAFEVPVDFNATDVIPSGASGSGEADEVATVRFLRDVAPVAVSQIPGITQEDVDDTCVDLKVPVRQDAAFVGWVLGFDDAAVIMEPSRLRERLLDHIRAAS
jgi:predicted DNA-binding transcriptional regulator YafY